MNILRQYRLRTINAIARKIESTVSTDRTDWDYKLDDVAREILNLPARPKGDLPYVGWLGEIKAKEDTTSRVPLRLTATRGRSSMSISQAGINLIKRWEGFRSNAYLCPGNVWTIGYGHTATVKPGMCINQVEAEELLKSDLRRFENAISNLVKVPLTQAQFDALTSFTFNVGIAAFGKSTLRKKLNRKDYSGAANEFSRWVHANGKRLPGLVSRRQEERKLFLS
ncbi:MAG: lysozyme [Xenococcaceae cyanobacterium]